MRIATDEMQGFQSLLKEAFARFRQIYPQVFGEGSSRQPVHTVYGGAHLFRADTAKKMGELAMKALRDYAPDASSLARALEWPERPELHGKVYSRMVAKLKAQAVEDFRIDFEDGFGARGDAEEDECAEAAAKETALGFAQGTLPPAIGIRIKSLSPELADRALRTLDIYLTTIVEYGGRGIPPGFAVTLPKVLLPEQVAALRQALDLLEPRLGLSAGRIKIEIMVEAPQALIGSAEGQSGACPLPELVRAAGGRCGGVHFGAYDYTSACDISVAYQGIGHSSCDFARSVMKAALAGTGIPLSDGANHLLPVGPHKAPKDGTLSRERFEENRAAVHRVWRQNHEQIRRSLIQGFYQGWDLHPAQIPIRYAAVYSFFLEGLAPASARLKSYIEKATRAGLAGQVFDDAASAQGLLSYFSRGLDCGAIEEEEIRETGLSGEEIRSRSFEGIMKTRARNLSR